MPAVEFNDFKGGIDLRRDVAMSASNVQAMLRNCYINSAKAIKKRPCLTLVATLEAGTKGLKAAGGKLNTFYSQGAAITHANALFRANRVTYDAGATGIAAVHYGEYFNGYLYCAIEFTNGTTKHFYLDGGSSVSAVWTTGAVLALGVFRTPTVPNGFRYEVTTNGTTGGAEPAWPTTIGATVADGTVTWTCRSFTVVDANCPHSKIVQKISQKVYAADGSDVAFCKTADPRDWTAASDAGFLPVGIEAAGSDTVTALGEYRGKLAVFFADSLQTWTVNADPALNAIDETVGNVGTAHKDSLGQIANDLIFLGKQGFRSLSLLSQTDNLQENDVGSPIDDVRGDINDSDNVIAAYYPAVGQLWEAVGTMVYAYSFSRSNKLSAWSIYEFPISIDDIAVLNNTMYVRSGDVIYSVDNGAYGDDGVPPLLEVEMFYQDAKTPGVLKQFIGFDGLVRGGWEIAFKYDPRNEALITDYLPIEGDLRPGDLLPMELCAVSIAPVFRHRALEDASIHSLLCHYEKLGSL